MAVKLLTVRQCCQDSLLYVVDQQLLLTYLLLEITKDFSLKIIGCKELEWFQAMNSVSKVIQSRKKLLVCESQHLTSSILTNSTSCSRKYVFFSVGMGAKV